MDADDAFPASETPPLPGGMWFLRHCSGFYCLWIVLALLALFIATAPACDWGDKSGLFFSWVFFGTVALIASIGLWRRARGAFARWTGAALSLALGIGYLEVVVSR